MSKESSVIVVPALLVLYAYLDQKNNQLKLSPSGKTTAPSFIAAVNYHRLTPVALRTLRLVEPGAYRYNPAKIRRDYFTAFIRRLTTAVFCGKMKHQCSPRGKPRGIQLHFSEAKQQSLHPCGKPQGIRRRRIKRKEIFFLFILSSLYLIARHALLKLPLAGVETPPFTVRTINFFCALLDYLKLLILPFNLHVEYGKAPGALNIAKIIAGATIFSGLLVYAFKKRKENYLVTFSILWFFLTLLPYANIYPINAYMAEHWLYLPSIGFFLVIAEKLSFLYKKNNLRLPLILLTLSLVIFYSIRTIQQNNYWREPLAFYKRTLRYSPKSARMWKNLADEYYMAGDFRKAVKLYKKTLAIEPKLKNEHEWVYNALGMYYFNHQDIPKAVRYLKKSLQTTPSAPAHYNLGLAYSALGNYKKAIEEYNQTIAMNNETPGIYYNLAVLYRKTGLPEDAIKNLEKAIKLDPDFLSAYPLLTGLYEANGKTKK